MNRAAQFSPRTVGILPLEVHEPRLAEAGDGHDHAVELREGLVAVLGERLRGVPAAHPRPGPLALVAVPVADEHVEEPGPQDRRESRRGPAGLSSSESRPDLVPVVDLLDVLEAGVTGGFVRGLLLEDAEHARRTPCGTRPARGRRG